jgi:hypothetical protein
MGAGTPLLTRWRPAGLAAALWVLWGCSDTTAITPQTPVSAVLEVEGTASDDILLLAGATVPAQVRFFNGSGAEITGIEDESFAKITFAPTTLASAADVPDEHFHKLITAGTQIGSGLAIVRFGHDSSASEQTFAPINVTVVVAAHPQLQ